MIQTETAVAVVGALPDDWLELLKEISMDTGCAVVAVNSATVHGLIHVRSSVDHAFRSFEAGTPRGRTIEMEIILYLLGERQIEKALSSSAPGDENIIITAGQDAVSALEKVLDRLGPRMGDVDEITDGTMEALERTACLDIAK